MSDLATSAATLIPILVSAITALVVPAVTYIVRSRVYGISAPSILVTQESLVDDVVTLLKLKYEVCLVSRSPSLLFRRKGKVYVSTRRSRFRSYDYVVASRPQLDALRALVSD